MVTFGNFVAFSQTHVAHINWWPIQVWNKCKFLQKTNYVKLFKFSFVYSTCDVIDHPLNSRRRQMNANQGHAHLGKPFHRDFALHSDVEFLDLLDDMRVSILHTERTTKWTNLTENYFKPVFTKFLTTPFFAMKTRFCDPEFLKEKAKNKINDKWNKHIFFTKPKQRYR